MTVAPVKLNNWSQTAAQRGWGGGWPGCSGIQKFGTLIVTAPRSGARMSVNKRIATLVQLLVSETERRGFLLKPGQCGSYNCRAISGTKTSSNHAWGLACDINWNDNPYTTSGKHTIPQWVYDLWARYGFANGSMYSGAKDWMHIEFMGSPEQCDAMTALAIAELGGSAPPVNVPILPVTDNIVWIGDPEMAFPVLKKGDGIKGAPNRRGGLHWYVLRLQAMLNCQGPDIPRSPMSGQFDDATDKAVRALQARQKIVVDGVVGPATLAWVHGNDAPDWV